MIFILQEFCSDSPETGSTACTAVDFTNKNQCFIHRTAANEPDKRTSNPGKVTHYVRESCGIYFSVLGIFGCRSRLCGPPPENRPNVLKCTSCAQD